MEELEVLTNDIVNDISQLKNEKELSEFYNKYIGNNGLFNKKRSEILKKAQDKKNCVLKINDLYKKIRFSFEEKKKNIINESLRKENIDITLPPSNLMIQGVNPIFLIKEKIEEIFLGLGFKIYNSSVVDSEHYNFTLMNIDKNHVSRDKENTFYIDNELLLCTHTSHAQAHAMSEAHGSPLRIISPGKCFRKDNDDLTHSHQFMQIEGLLIDKNINLGHLIGILDIFIKKIFGDNRKMRLRNSFFPFTEPSIEVDICCDNCQGSGCAKCKNTGFIEILGAGVVNPNVLKMNGYDCKKYTGLAFGIGVERIAILKYGIDSIRRFYTNDIRFLRKFKI